MIENIKLIGIFILGLMVGGAGAHFKKNMALEDALKQERIVYQKLKESEITTRNIEKELELSRKKVSETLVERNRALNRKVETVKKVYINSPIQSNQVSKEDGLFILELAKKADDLKNRLSACQSWVKRLTEKVE